MSISVGIVGTGYAATVRAKALLEDERSRLVSVASQAPQRAAEFAAQYGMTAAAHWSEVVSNDAVDLVVVATISHLHGAVVEAAIAAGKHVVVEYPLSFDLSQAERLVQQARAQGQLLHVEHIELLGGLHLAMRSHIAKIGAPYYVSYRTLNPQSPAPRKWTYHREQFGFPFCGALSRVHRLTNLFGRVRQVDCCTQMMLGEADDDYFKRIVSSGRLQFENGVVAEVTYGKGEGLWIKRRDIEVQGRLGAMSFTGNEGRLTTAEGTSLITVAPRKGLFLKDTQGVLDYLTVGTPLYVNVEEGLYALRVGDALRRASVSGQPIVLD